MPTFQLDVFNYATDCYDVAATSSDPLALRETAKACGFKAWRIWDRTGRAERDRMLPPVSAIVKTHNHVRRWSRVHKSPAGRCPVYQDGIA